ncbi:MAG TPA: peptidoglycan bridge formation glycyltransferase FemA/FemB family protein [Treponemataceae bacterium]|nr:peptidoglycan bridge formation glycyltransferase FemA/FemB family protein [Treponemataceae bacterium]
MTLIPIELTKNSISGEPECSPPSSFLQTPFWAEFKASYGWTPHYFKVTTTKSFFLSVLVKKVARIFSIAYIPMGPDIKELSPEHQGNFLELLAKELQAFLPTDTIYIRFDPPWGTEVLNNQTFTKETDIFPKKLVGNLIRSVAAVQPPDTLILDLSLDEEALLAQMKSKWRYNIRLGEKKGLQIDFLEGIEGIESGIDIFYRLYVETAARDGIAIHSRSYYEELLKRSSTWANSTWDKPLSVRIYVARHEGDELASIITLFCGEEAVYLYGASSNIKRNLMPAYSLQWQAIRDAQKFGCTRYDFYGIPPTDDPDHPMYGLYRFKTGFGGSIVHRVGSFDIPIKPLMYGLWSVLESLRGVWYKRVKKIFIRGIPRKS